MYIIVMGVAGSGKSTVGKLLAKRLQWPFYDGDDFHPPENIEKISRGEALNDSDREPWLKAIKDMMESHDGPAVIACSALKKSYRDYIRGKMKKVRFVYLKGTRKILEMRLSNRKRHFAGAGILESQLETLEEPDSAVVEDIERDPGLITQDIILKLFKDSRSFKDFA